MIVSLPFPGVQRDDFVEIEATLLDDSVTYHSWKKRRILVDLGQTSDRQCVSYQLMDKQKSSRRSAALSLAPGSFFFYFFDSRDI